MTERYEKSPAGRLGFRLSKKGKEAKEASGEKSGRRQSHASLRGKVQAARRMPPKGVVSPFSFKITPRKDEGTPDACIICPHCGCKNTVYGYGEEDD